MCNTYNISWSSIISSVTIFAIFALHVHVCLAHIPTDYHQLLTGGPVGPDNPVGPAGPLAPYVMAFTLCTYIFYLFLTGAPGSPGRPGEPAGP